MEPASLELQAFGAGDELDALGETRQVKYARRYLTGLGATSTLVEPHYFDRDYLAEHSAFYSLSTRGYPNHCRRLHFFKGEPLTRKRLELVAAGDAKACTDLQDDYLGFIVVRPIVSAPFGRTVLKWWDDGAPMTPRVTHPSRKYTAHLLGQELRVEGLAWQQQDTGVGGCATVALWSMLHSSALDEHHAIPTTVSITQRAHRTASLGSRVFPSPGLTLFQISEAIKESGLEPLPIEGDLKGPLGRQPFSRDVFAVHVSALLRSGYPVLLSGELEGNGLHAVCAVGFREATASPAPAGKLAYQDEETPFFYVHDDNIGPNVRMAMTTTDADKRVVLRPSAPPLGGSANDDATKGYPGFVPYMLLAAVPDTLRVSAGVLHGACIKVGRGLLSVFEQAAKAQGTANAVGLTVSSRFMKVADYIGNELARLLGAQPPVLAAVRLALIEEVVPMSLHVGVARIGVGPKPLLDVLYDTSESDRNIRAFCHVCYLPGARAAATILAAAHVIDLGSAISAHP